MCVSRVNSSRNMSVFLSICAKFQFETLFLHWAVSFQSLVFAGKNFFIYDKYKNKTYKKYITYWNRLEVEIAMGCSVSPILFVQAMQLLLKATENCYIIKE